MEHLLDKISDSEYTMLSTWRNWYAQRAEHIRADDMVSIRSLLGASWEPNKQKLYHLFGDKLIISKTFEYEKSPEELVSELENMIDAHQSYGRENRQGWEFVSNYYDWYHEAFKIPQVVYNTKTGLYDYANPVDKELANRNAEIKNGLSNLMSYWCLAENKFNGDSFTIELKDGKRYTISEGCKPMKALAKIAEAYDIKGFEDFRICHSLVHNQKKITGEIFLSIHPLDYWTMSDNNCGWSSCMSWADDGGYKQGTVEMMNSPCVVVAYMTSKNSYNINGNVWNDKKWRQLFIVNDQCILGIKSYPYYNEELTNTIAKWLKELAETNMGWQYFGDKKDEPLKYFPSEKFYHPEHKDDKYPIKFEFYSNNMYRDVGALDFHPLYISTEIHEHGNLASNMYTNTRFGESTLTVEINYSGEAQCMSCGELDPEFEDEGCLCCEECYEGSCCAECGGHISDDDGYWVDDTYICEYCYNQYAAQCFLCDDTHFKEKMTPIYVKVPMTAETKKKVIDKYGIYDYSEDHSDCELWALLCTPMYVCDSDDFDGLKSRFLLEDAEIKTFDKMYQKENFYIDVNDVNLDTYPWRYFFPYGYTDTIIRARQTGNYEPLIMEYRYETEFIVVKKTEA